MASNIPDTPMMQQFRKIKEQYPDAMLLFRCGDFYETYAEDAVKASKVLNITLTHRSSGTSSVTGTEMAGFPFHALDTYLPKLVRAGMRVAICDQLEDPKLTKKLVKRGVTELVTPGVSYSETTLTGKENNFVACVCLPNGKKRKGGDKTAATGAVPPTGIAFLDISTGEFLTAEGRNDYIEKLLGNFQPKEVLFERGLRKEFEALFGNKFFTFELEDWMLTYDSAFDRLLKQFGTGSLKGFGVDNLHAGVTAAGAILHYLDMTQHLQTGHIQTLSRIEEDRYMWLDRFTLRNLELFASHAEGAKTLLDVLDQTQSPMGARLLRRWIAFPLKEADPIRRRQQVVEYCFRQPEVRDELTRQISGMGDLERIAGRISTGRINPRELLQLSYALQALQTVKQLCTQSGEQELQRMGESIALCEQMRERIRLTIAPDASSVTNKPGYIRDGVDEELDRLRHIQRDGKDYLLGLQQREAEQTGIPSLKVGFNNVFGYYLEVRNTYKEQVPPEWIRKQTLAQAERYITEELKQYEQTITGAEERIAVLEQRIYTELLVALSSHVAEFMTDAHITAQLDCLLSFARTALQNRYVCPEINDSLVIDIRQGRHPVIEQQLPVGETYVPNDILFDNNSQQIIVLTGPNMAGKSALLRQTALIVLMAQTGSFVPAESASIGIVDKIFTRVGASDNISAGESTFMVEMNEAAAILNNLSERSLVLFDELGRGTSTYDGISIAWAIVEYIHEQRGHAKTLFATHYHELNEMEQSFSRIRNYNVSVREVGKKVIFLRKLVRGGSEHSFGIQVAKMAGMPPSIIKRAEKILHELEDASKNGHVGKPTEAIGQSRDGLQLSFFQLDDPVLEQIRDEIKTLDINSLTPLEALNKLSDIKRIVTGK
ncbi:MAG: DNA mismatch repair protein MutS [Paludibacteraceae bacterium]|nr:DNA mismatch repair protein MutS [Paludibacteraceae bacterium]